MSAKKVWAVVIGIIIVACAVVFGLYGGSTDGISQLDISGAEKLVNDTFDSMAIAEPAKLIAEKNEIKVKSISEGEEKNLILECSVSTVDVHSAVKPRYDEFLGTSVKKQNSTMFKSALDFKLEFQKKLSSIVSELDASEKDCVIEIFDTKDGLVVYADDKVVNTVYGGVLTLEEEVSGIDEYSDASGGKHKIQSSNVKKGLINCFELRYENEKPDTSTLIGRWWNGIKKDFENNFISHDRWKTIFKGLWQTLKLTFFSLIIGIILGFLIAFVRCTYLKTAKPGVILKLLNAISQVYLTVTRGTPVVVQIMIIYFVIFMPMGVDKFLAAVICFGLNSGAYVAEIVRGGIMSIDDGQTEAGRSLGFGYMETMFYIVFPQAFKAVLPSLANEFVVLLKETSIAFYIGLGDLMYSVNAIRAATYSPFMPLVAAAVIYLVMVLALSKLVSLLERRLRNNER